MTNKKHPKTYIFGKSISIGIDFSALIIIIYALFCGNIVHTLLIACAAFLHELGHIAAAIALKVHIKKLKLSLIGATLIINGIFSYKSEILLCICGPLSNFITFLLFYPLINCTLFSSVVREGISYFCGINFMLMFINLLPLSEFDGGRILFSVTAQCLGIEAAEFIGGLLSGVIIIILWIISVYMILKYESTLSLFVFSVMLFAKLFIKPET